MGVNCKVNYTINTLTIFLSENERLWIDEAERRYQKYKNGNISARPAVDALRDARSFIR